MADPFSAITGVLGVLDVSIRFGNYLTSVASTTKHFDEEIEALRTEVKNFQNVYTALEQLCKARPTEQTPPYSSRRSSIDADPSSKLWTRAAAIIEEGKVLVEQLNALLVKIVGNEHSDMWKVVDHVDKVRKAVKLLSRDKKYGELRQRLTSVNLELNLMMTALDLISNAVFRTDTKVSLEHLPQHISTQIQELGLQLKTQIDELEKSAHEPNPAIISAKAAISFASLTQHFYVQKSDVSIWTGRRKPLEDMKTALLDRKPSDWPTQRRFVVHGIAGAGKTQFCCKFAQDYRENFWGIFWVDASSPTNATESWKRIARIGGRDSKEEAGKDWLSNAQSPWLLIIDSADKSRSSVENQFPVGDRGCVIVTTRNPRIKILATVGSLSLDRLNNNEAQDLLRRTSDHKPWDESAKTSADFIAKRLGYLPLALVHAGRAIYNRICSLQGYLPHFTSALVEVRSKQLAAISTDDEENNVLGAFTTFDIIYAGLESQAQKVGNQLSVHKDALELINVFCFFQSSDIRLETFTRAGDNLYQMAGEARKGNIGDVLATEPENLTQILKRKGLELMVWLTRETPVLPHILANTIRCHRQDPNRMRRAVNVLVQMSMISESSDDDCYSMHPLVHIWVRARLSLAEKSMWCQVATNVLASSIKLPPMPDAKGDFNNRLQLYPHVVELLQLRKILDDDFEQKQRGTRESMLRSWLWPPRSGGFGQIDALNSARFSRVFVECGQWDEARSLLARVREYLIIRAGEQHMLTVRVTIALGTTLTELSRFQEAAELLQNSLTILQQKLGDDDAQTLRLKDALGDTYWKQGRYVQSETLHVAAVNGLQALKAKSDKRLQDRGQPPIPSRDLLVAKDHLGRLLQKYLKHQEAEKLHREALEGLEAAYGAEDFDTLFAMDNLAMLLLETGNIKQLEEALQLELRVFEARKSHLGREHPYTLWATANYSRVKARLGYEIDDIVMIQEAKATLAEGIEIATRNLGPEHIGTIFGKQHYAYMAVYEKRYGEAEKLLKNVAELQRTIIGEKYGTHPDRLGTLDMLSDCYEIQGRYMDAIAMEDMVLEEICWLPDGGTHPFNDKIRAKKMELVKKSQLAAAG